MRKYDHNEAEIERLTDEIRKLGTPYASSEPDERYWANFRVRVMDQISQTEQRKAARWSTVLTGWVQEHILVASLSAAAVLFAISLTLMLQPFGSNEPLKQTAQVSGRSEGTNQTQIAPAQPELAQTATPQATPAQSSAENKLPAQSGRTSAVHHTARPEQPSLASLDLPVENSSEAIENSNESVAPVSLDDLSAPELESVLRGLQDQE